MYVQERPRGTSNKWYVDSGCSRHMTGNADLLHNVKPYHGGEVKFAGAKGGAITGQGHLGNESFGFGKVNYCEQLKHNLLSVSQMCDHKVTVYFDKKECLVLKPGVKIPDEWILMRAPRTGNTYQLDMDTARTTSEEYTALLSDTKASEEDSIL